MKILATSDLHVDEEGISSSRQKTIYKDIDEIVARDADVLLVGGDIARKKEALRAALDKMSAFKGIKLAYLGNHELRLLESDYLGNHYTELGAEFSKFGFHLLDVEPKIINDIGFVGNCGWFDFTHYRGQKEEDHKRMALRYYYSAYRTKISPQDFTSHCLERIVQQISSISEKCSQIVLGIHHIGFSEQLKYGHSEEYDYKNLLMGSKLFESLYENKKIMIGLCGHNHRPGKFRYENFIVYNISYKHSQPSTMIEVDVK